MRIIFSVNNLIKEFYAQRGIKYNTQDISLQSCLLITYIITFITGCQFLRII